VKLNHAMPRCAPALCDRIERLLDKPHCDGYRCGGNFAALRRRMVGGYETLHMQCTHCGRSISGSLTKRECFDFASLNQWDDALPESWRRKIQADFETEHQARVRELTHHQETRQSRRARYAEWLRTSPEWRAVRSRVMRRANFVCECCLETEARDVHHETYELGVLPPAWLLRAVCRTCHQSLHNFEPVTV